MRRHLGFTIIELMITLVIGGILAALAAPSFTTFFDNTRFSSAVIQLQGDFNQARSEAIKRNSRVLICIRNTAGTDCGTGSNWASGWVVCQDANNDNACDAGTAANPNPITVRGPLPARLTLAGNAAASPLVRFNANGTQGTGTVATLTLCATGRSTYRTMTIAATGNLTSADITGACP